MDINAPPLTAYGHGYRKPIDLLEQLPTTQLRLSLTANHKGVASAAIEELKNESKSSEMKLPIWAVKMLLNGMVIISNHTNSVSRKADLTTPSFSCIKTHVIHMYLHIIYLVIRGSLRMQGLTLVLRSIFPEHILPKGRGCCTPPP